MLRRLKATGRNNDDRIDDPSKSTRAGNSGKWDIGMAFPEMRV
jgi:hypothetical protein